MIALNSWSPQHGATLISHAGESRIDFILTRHRDADNLAKQIGVLEAAPFLPTGAHHVAMMTSLNYKFYRPSRSQHHDFSRQVRKTPVESSGRIQSSGDSVLMASAMHSELQLVLTHLMISMTF